MFGEFHSDTHYHSILIGDLATWTYCTNRHHHDYYYHHDPVVFLFSRWQSWSFDEIGGSAFTLITSAVGVSLDEELVAGGSNGGNSLNTSQMGLDLLLVATTEWPRWMEGVDHGRMYARERVETPRRDSCQSWLMVANRNGFIQFILEDPLKWWNDSVSEYRLCKCNYANCILGILYRTYAFVCVYVWMYILCRSTYIYIHNIFLTSLCL